jgi:hypothetical protein
MVAIVVAWAALAAAMANPNAIAAATLFADPHFFIFTAPPSGLNTPPQPDISHF